MLFLLWSPMLNICICHPSSLLPFHMIDCSPIIFLLPTGVSPPSIIITALDPRSFLLLLLHLGLLSLLDFSSVVLLCRWKLFPSEKRKTNQRRPLIFPLMKVLSLTTPSSVKIIFDRRFQSFSRSSDLDLIYYNLIKGLGYCYYRAS